MEDKRERDDSRAKRKRKRNNERSLEEEEEEAKEKEKKETGEDFIEKSRRGKERGIRGIEQEKQKSWT